MIKADSSHAVATLTDRRHHITGGVLMPTNMPSSAQQNRQQLCGFDTQKLTGTVADDDKENPDDPKTSTCVSARKSRSFDNVRHGSATTGLKEMPGRDTIEKTRAISSVGQSTSMTRWGSQVRALYRPLIRFWFKDSQFPGDFPPAPLRLLRRENHHRRW